MKKKFPFGPVADIPDSWTNLYTGQVRTADEPLSPDILLKKKNSINANPFAAEHSGAAKPTKPRESEASEPDIIHFNTNTRDLEAARQFILQENNIESEPRTETYVRDPHRLIVGALLDELGPNTKQIQLEGPTLDAQTQAQGRFKVQQEQEHTRAQFDAIFQAEIESMDLSDPRLGSYAQTLVAGMAPAVLSSVPLQGPDDKIAHELVWDILTSRGTGSDQTLEAQVSNPELGAFIKQRVLTQAHQQSMAQEKLAAMRAAEAWTDYVPNTDKPVSDKFMLSADIQYVLKAAKTELKNDALVQERVGTWALSVMGQSVKLDKSALRKGLKKQGLQALGRIAMQLLCTMKTGSQVFGSVHTTKFGAENHQTVGAASTRTLEGRQISQTNSKQGMDMEKQGFVSDGPTPQIQITKIRDMFKEESWIQNLQEIQTLVPFEETADVALESLREILLEETSSEAEALRQDILAGSIQAQSVLEAHFARTELGTSRSIYAHNDSEVGTISKSSLRSRLSADTETQSHAQLHIDGLAKRASVQQDRKSAKSWGGAKAFAIRLDTDGDQGPKDNKRAFAEQ